MNLIVTTTNNNSRIHPHKFTLWVGLGSIVMIFAALTSAYVVKRAQAGWLDFRLPAVFWFSTVTILLSSATMHVAYKSFKAREAGRYRLFITLTAALGILFAVLQILGFGRLEAQGIPIIGVDSNPAASFLGVITGVHIAHILGGVVVLLLLLARAYSKRRKTYSTVPVELAATYWHFVDLIWIYLFIFFQLVR